VDFPAVGETASERPQQRGPLPQASSSCTPLPAPRARDREGATSRRPRGPRPSRLRACTSASRSARGV